jgi:hypothetical protein
MVRLFEKIKGSFASRNKRGSLRQPQSPSTTPAPESLAPAAPDPPVTSLATTRPAAVIEAPVAQDPPATAREPASPPVIMTRGPRVKMTRITRRANRPHRVIRESRGDDVEDTELTREDTEHTASERVSVVAQKPTSHQRTRTVRIVRPKVRVVR